MSPDQTLIMVGDQLKELKQPIKFTLEALPIHSLATVHLSDELTPKEYYYSKHKGGKRKSK